MFYAQKELPLASIKSPRRNTKFIELESISSASQSIEYLNRKYSLMHIQHEYGSSCTNLVAPSSKPNDYLHPKYSLPPISIDVSQHLLQNKI
uniref:Uncharacterized protein n=1 Tax=Panagrolaimus sp. PS1159 TaxID=55785 RepID=A0AC35FYT8_9BILA